MQDIEEQLLRKYYFALGIRTSTSMLRYKLKCVAEILRFDFGKALQVATIVTF